MSYFAELSMRHVVLSWKVFKGLWYHIHLSGEVFTDSPKQDQVVMAIDLAKHRDTSPIPECPAHCRAYISALGHRTGKFWEYCYSSGVPQPHDHST